MRSNLKWFVYTAYSKNYSWSTTVRATSIKTARQQGYREAKQVFGNHAPIRSDKVEEQ